MYIYVYLYICTHVHWHVYELRAATNLIASAIVSPIYVVVTNPLSRLEVTRAKKENESACAWVWAVVASCMSVCMHACMHELLCVCMDVCVHACMCACMHVCIHVRTHRWVCNQLESFSTILQCMQAHMWSCRPIRIYIYIYYMYIYMYIYLYIHILYVYIYLYIYIYIYIYKYISIYSYEDQLVYVNGPTRTHTCIHAHRWSCRLTRSRVPRLVLSPPWKRCPRTWASLAYVASSADRC